MAGIMKIACVTTCKGRKHHLKETLPQNLRDNPAAIFVILDYNDQDNLGEYLRREYAGEISSGRLIYYRNFDEPKFGMAHAKNQAHRCAIQEGADILVTLDADNFTGPGFANHIRDRFCGDSALSFICPDFNALPPRGHRFNASNPLRLGRGFAGRLAIRANDFLKAGGYNERFETWRGEDIDMIARLDRLRLKKGAIDPVFLNAIAHSTAVRFREYPDAERYENDEIYTATENAHDTVVNDGRFGCGVVYRNFDLCTPVTLTPIPTRVFGIGMMKTGTTSLHEAFQTLGFDSGHWKSAEWAKTIWWEMNKWGRSRTLEQDQALCDNPIPILYEKLDRAYPGSKFILTVRDEDEWIRSMENFWTYEGNPRRWTWDVDGFSHKMHGIIYGQIEFNEKIFRERYRKHNSEVENYFDGRPDFLRLKVNGETSMEELCRFLGRPVVNTKFPHQHKLTGGLRDSPIRPNTLWSEAASH
jgi:hypothetical protein